MHAQPYSEAPANLGRGRGRTSGGKRPVAVQIVRDLLHSRSGSGSGCFTDQSYFWIANRVYQSWLLRFSRCVLQQTHLIKSLPHVTAQSFFNKIRAFWFSNAEAGCEPRGGMPVEIAPQLNTDMHHGFSIT